jgi:hypothetical protein
MATALALNATSTLVADNGLAPNDGNGLVPNANLLAQIFTFVSRTPIAQLANIFARVSQNATASANLMPILTTIGSGSPNRWLLDLCDDITPVTINSNIILGKLPVYGNISSNYLPRFSTTIRNQANGPFTGGMATFANVYTTVSSYAISNFETAASAFMLSGQTYADAGIGFTGPGDVATGGIGSSGRTISAAVSGWGTMYDIKNISTAGDTYVFGQNILKQKLGTYGNLANQLTSVGLDITDLTTIPSSTSTTNQEPSTSTATSFVGPIEIPGLTNVTTTTVVTGSSPDVVKNIYATVTGSNLSAIISATNFTGDTSQITSLKDFLDLSKVVPANVLPTLANLKTVADKPANTFSTFGQFVDSKVGQGNFKSWKELSDFLGTIEVPVLSNTVPDANAPLLANVSALTGVIKGSGQFQNLVISDLLGITAGMNSWINANISTLNNSYNSIVTAGLTTAMNNLNTCVNQFLANTDAGNVSAVASNVSAVTTALNNITGNTANICQTTYTTMWANVQNEISALKAAGVDYSGTTTSLNSFAQNFPSTASDKDKLQTYQFFANIIAPNAAGDALKAAVAETINTKILGSKGITLNNNADPSAAIAGAAKQGITVKKYISQNK